MEVFRAWGKGLSPAVLSETFELSPATVEEIIDIEMRSRRTALRHDPINLLLEHQWKVESIIEDLALIGSRESGSVRVRALVAKFEALKHLLELNQAVGALPEYADLLLLRDGVAMADGMLDLLERRGLLSVELLSDIQAEFPGSQPAQPRAEIESITSGD